MNTTILTTFDRLMTSIAFAEENEPETARTLLNGENDPDTKTTRSVDLNAVQAAQASR